MMTTFSVRLALSSPRSVRSWQLKPRLLIMDSITGVLSICLGAIIKTVSGNTSRIFSYTSSIISSSPSRVLPATKTRCEGSRFRSCRISASITGSALLPNRSYLALPFISIFRGSAPIDLMRAASSSRIILKTSKFSRTSRKKGRSLRYPPIDLTDIRPLIKAVLIPMRCASKSHAGQSSVSRKTMTSGRTVNSALRTEPQKSMGA